MVDSDDSNDRYHNKVDSMPRTDLYSHANMVLLDRDANIIACTGKTANTSPFNPDYKSIENVPIVDGAVTYECPYSGKCSVLLWHIALHIPFILNNLIPPFIIQEAGLIVNDTSNIHVEQITQSHHSLYFKDNDLHNPLSLYEVFYYFTSRSSSAQDISNEVGFLHLTPNILTWNPHSEVYARNEENILN